jgi:adenosylcobinamide-GDP ribazoletransferase
VSRSSDELAEAFCLLTRLPAGRFLPAAFQSAPSSCVWAYPVVGLVVGLLGGMAFWLATRFGMAPLLAAGWTLAVMVGVTGGFHEDGLADTADGFGGGRTRERKLQIMRDSHIGSFGTIALMLSLAIRTAAIATGVAPVMAIIVAATLGRAAMAGLLLTSQPARSDGLAASLQRVSPMRSAAALTIAALTSVALLTPPAAFAVIFLSLAVVWAMTRLAARQIGGYTGDVLGATEIVVECVVLSALAV